MEKEAGPGHSIVRKNGFSLHLRIALDVVVTLTGLAVFFGAWILLGVTVTGTHLAMVRSFELSAVSPEVRTVLLQSHHSFDGIRLFLSILGLLLVAIGCFSFYADSRAERGVS